MVELVIGNGDERGFVRPPTRIRQDNTGEADDGALTYTGTYQPENGGNYAYGVRVMPTTEGLGSPFEAHLIQWG